MEKPAGKANLHFTACERIAIKAAVKKELQRLGFDTQHRLSTLHHALESITNARTVETVICRVFTLGKHVGKGAYLNG